MTNGYLLDTNICIEFFRGRFDLLSKIEEVDLENISVSEITLAELYYGAERSMNPTKHHKQIKELQALFEVIPISTCLKRYASLKAALKQKGNAIDEFDLLIGATAIANDMILVTNNTRHMERLQGIRLEDWTQSA